MAQASGSKETGIEVHIMCVSLNHAKLSHALLHMPAQCHQLLNSTYYWREPSPHGKELHEKTSAPLCSRTCLELYIPYIFPFVCRSLLWPNSAGWEVSISLWLCPVRGRVGQSRLPRIGARLSCGQRGEAQTRAGRELRHCISSKNTTLRQHMAF